MIHKFYRSLFVIVLIGFYLNVFALQKILHQGNVNMKTTILLFFSTLLFSSLAQAQTSLVTDCPNRSGTWYKGKCSVAKGSTSTKVIEATKGTKDSGTCTNRKPRTCSDGATVDCSQACLDKKGNNLAPTISSPKVLLPGKPTRPPIRTDQPVPFPPKSSKLSQNNNDKSHPPASSDDVKIVASKNFIRIRAKTKASAIIPKALISQPISIVKDKK